MIWQKTFGEGFGNAVISTADGGFVVAGARLSGDGDDAVNSSLLVKTDVEGNVLWSKEYEGNGFTGVVNVTDGGYVMLGTFNVNSTVAPCLMKVDAEGNLQWTHTYSRSEADAVKLYTLVATSDGGYAMAGEIQYTTNGGLVRQGWLVKTAPNGDVEVSRPFSMDGWTVFYSLAQANDGGFMLAGATANASDVPYSACLLRTDSDGHSLWSRINATSNDVHGFTEDGLGYQLYSLAKFSNGNYVVTGYSSQNLFTVEIFKDTGDVLQRESSGGSALTRTMTYVTPVAQGVFAPGYAYISYSNGSIHFTEEYSYVPED